MRFKVKCPKCKDEDYYKHGKPEKSKQYVLTCHNCKAKIDTILTPNGECITDDVANFVFNKTSIKLSGEDVKAIEKTIIGLFVFFFLIVPIGTGILFTWGNSIQKDAGDLNFIVEKINNDQNRLNSLSDRYIQIRDQAFSDGYISSAEINVITSVVQDYSDAYRDFVVDSDKFEQLSEKIWYVDENIKQSRINLVNAKSNYLSTLDQMRYQIQQILIQKSDIDQAQQQQLNQLLTLLSYTI